MPFLQLKQRFHYLDSTNPGPPIVLIHSTGIGAKQWLPYFQLLSGHRLLAIDLLGYGESDPWTNNSSIGADLEAAEALVLQLSEPVHLIGHSYGGVLAMRLAQRHPAAVRSLLLHEPVAWGSIFDSPDTSLAEHFLGVRERFFSSQHPPSTEEWLQGFVDFWNRPGTWQSFPERTKAIWRLQADKVYAEVHNLCFDSTPVREWAGLSMPTCITMGQHSPPAEREVCQLLNQTLPDCRLIEHAGGHLAPVTHFAAVAPIVREWLG